MEMLKTLLGSSRRPPRQNTRQYSSTQTQPHPGAKDPVPEDHEFGGPPESLSNAKPGSSNRPQKSLETLRKACRKYAKDEEFQSSHPELCTYIDALVGVEATYSRIISHVKEVEPGIANLMRQDGPGVPEYFQHLIVAKATQAAEITKLSGDTNTLRGQLRTCNKMLEQKDDKIQQLNDKQKSQEDRHVEDKKNMKEIHDAVIQSINESNQAELDRRETEHQKKLDNQKTKTTQTIEDMTVLHDAKVAHLQAALLTTIDGFKPLTDSEFSNRIDCLRQKIHALAWYVVGFDSEDLARGFNQEDFVRISEKKDHKYVMEAYTWAILFQAFFSTPFCVLGRYGEHFTTTWFQLFETTNFSDSSATFSWPAPSTSSETWRYVTFETLRKSLNSPMPLRESYQRNIQEVKGALSKVLEKVSSKGKEIDIQKIIDEAASLALDFGVQRCRWQLFAPRANDVISTRDLALYEDLNKVNDPADDAHVRLAVKPGLRKTGDLRGGSFDRVTNLRSAGVYVTL